ncbi:uncharacterized protein STEHIDRAFT_156746 [Stereum hirsutum FP-91666 SS1]|uniref:uncharacterized protein n=1 Tax=Stereum hirsutum (strain FP-91666) TaxID=721885 RepID=UPI000440ECCD|nr:uncharacterized protein STEHIDRAFT_156746 [Stereum hirsutum FP-91666 SS1]EIM86432.1 hypothetical protein STEHIDRAFT_156746 [Stereum hirsutum FP-91666 SS1]
MPPKFKFQPGQIINYMTTHPKFAISSASTTGRPALKARPCVVVTASEDGSEITVFPFCGAQKDNNGQFLADHIALQMKVADWNRLEFVNVQSGQKYPVPSDSLNRTPIQIRNDTSNAQPTAFKGIKPSFVWVGDEEGEKINLNQKPIGISDLLSPYIQAEAKVVDEILSRAEKITQPAQQSGTKSQPEQEEETDDPAH